MRARSVAVWSKWRGLVSEQESSGQSVSAFCRERGLCAPHMFSWKKRLRQSAAEGFVEVQVTDVQAALGVGSASQTVEVSGAAPLVNTTSPDFAGVIPEETLHEVPENNYRWSAFALLTPGVVNDSNGYGLLSFRGQSTLRKNPI